MKKLIFVVPVFVSVLLFASIGLAAPDQYPGDTSIYGSSGTFQPNVLIIIDTSGSMGDKVPGASYDPAITYPEVHACGSNGGAICNNTIVYKSDYTVLNGNVSNITTSCNSANPQSLLQTTGQYSGRKLKSGGTCDSSGSDVYYMGNYINYLNTSSGAMKQKIAIARDAVKSLVTSTNGVKFGLMTFHYVGNNGQGAEFLNATVSGAGATKYVTTLKKMDDIFTGTITNRTALLAAIDSIKENGSTPLGESLFEAMRYFSGEASVFGNTVGITAGKYVSPVEAPCQKNYVIFVTDGMATADDDPVLKTICTNGDCDGDGIEPNDLNHSLDDVAKALNLGPQQVVTYTIGFGLTGADADAVALLKRAADSSHGKGTYFNAGSEQQLSSAFSLVMTNVFSVDTSFVAPVAPVSPENRTYSSSRIFMGFFKPHNGAFWGGNLKKYGVSSGSDPNLIDATGALATYIDLNGDSIDDKTLALLPTGAVNGTLKSTVASYWSPSADGSQTEKGGVGQLLQSRALNTRAIYTMLPAGNSLVAFNNTNVTPAMLGVADNATRDNLINYVNGQDVYDEDLNGITTEARQWLLGDVLHAKPLVVNYASFPFTTANEADCTVNKSIIYVGSNDGMLHAFSDCNGAELWGFIPPDMLGNLHYLKDSSNHLYFTDASPVAYTYDANSNGTIDSGDKVILLFGERRGGGVAAGTATGSYYALDVTDPSAPQFMWRISNSSPTGGSPVAPFFVELAESWSEPKLVKMRIGSSDKIVAIIGGGYDNLNEDGRYGATQTYSGTGVVSNTDTGHGGVTSSGTAVPANPKGRGIYFIEVATLVNGVPNFTNSGTKISGFVNGSTAPYSTMTFSFPSDISPVDLNNNGYTQRVYAADTGGNIWRFDVADTNTANWTARKLFSANPGSGGTSDVGRKFFYKLSVVSEIGSKILFLGSGDREHPLNTAVVDRIYALIDRDQTSTKTESDLINVTADQLQTTTIASGTGSVADLLSKLNAATNFGWYIKLSQNSGEKVLGSPLIFNKVAYFTTFSPDATASTDACLAGNMGTARVYALNYLTGEAVMNYDLSNDNTVTANKRAKSGSTILQGSDRVKTIGAGIPSSPGAIITPGGGSKLMIGGGNGVAMDKMPPGGGVIPLYWRQK